MQYKHGKQNTCEAYAYIIKKKGLYMKITNNLPQKQPLQNAIDKVAENIATMSSNLENKTRIEEYKFNTSADVTSDEYTVQHTGWAMIYYCFAKTTYSQFGLFVNNANVFGTNITSNTNTDGLSGAIPLYLNAGDIVKVSYYSTFRMNTVNLRLRY